MLDCEKHTQRMDANVNSEVSLCYRGWLVPRKSIFQSFLNKTDGSKARLDLGAIMC